MSPRSTVEVAEKVGIHLRTLQRWVEEGRVKPKKIQIGKKTYLIWTESELRALRMVKERTYRKGRGRKKRLGK